MDVVQQLLHASEPGQENQILLTGETVRPVSRLSTVKDKLTNMIWGTAEAFNTDTSNIAEAIPDMENARSKTKDTDTTQYSREKDHSASDYHFPRFGFNQSKPSMPSKLPEQDTASVFNPKAVLVYGDREADRERRYVRNEMTPSTWGLKSSRKPVQSHKAELTEQLAQHLITLTVTEKCLLTGLEVTVPNVEHQVMYQ